MPRQLPSAARHYRLSSLLALRAAREARRVAKRGPSAVATVIATHQLAQAVSSERGVAEMLKAQDINVAADAALNALAFITELDRLEAMIGATAEAELERLVESLVQGSGRAAESVAIAVRPDIYFVRYLSPPSCARCAVLAGRVYRWSQGFPRHPNCDCVMIPTTAAAPYAQDPVEMFKQGLVTGLSKADTKAIQDGASFDQVVNVRRRHAGLVESGRVLARAGKPTPEGIYRMAGDDREKAVALLAKYGYIT